MRALRALGSAFAYFTVLPVGRFTLSPAPDADALSFLPFVGAFLGLLVAGAMLLARWAFGDTAASFTAIASVWLLTGALHVDGYLDCADALFASVSVERRHEILKDPRHGTFALAGMALLAGAWWVAVSPLQKLDPIHVVAVFVIALASARLAAVFLAYLFPYGRAGTPTAAFVAKPNPWVLLTIWLALHVLIVLFVPMASVVVIGAIAFAALAAKWMASRLGGGLVGDCYGAIIAILEPGIVFAVASMLIGNPR
ncbi:MAG: adenosylcobinamide-GDP ribazoletransferase [Vulcanimicrobiaceae bacterium]